MARVCLIAACIAIVVTITAAQTQAPKASFEVASIKRSAGTQGASIGDQPGGRFVASYITLRRVIQFAYRDNQQFIGGPDWLDSDRWDIEAKAPQGASTFFRIQYRGARPACVHGSIAA